MRLPCLRILAAVVFLPGAGSLQAQDPEPALADSAAGQHADSAVAAAPDPMPSWHDMVTNLPGDWSRGASAAFRTESLPFVAGLAVLTGSLIATDRTTNDWSRRMYDSSPFIHNTSDVLVNVGDGKAHLGIAAGFALYGAVAADSRALRTASQTVESLLACGLFVQALKRITGRESPAAATSGSGVWRPFPGLKQYDRNAPRYYAFPSGHMATTMSTVTVIAENYPEAGWIRPVGYTLIGMLGVSLANKGYHWYSDFPLGLALGYGFGMVVTSRNAVDVPPQGVPTPCVNFAPSAGGRGAQVEVRMSF